MKPRGSLSPYFQQAPLILFVLAAPASVSAGNIGLGLIGLAAVVVLTRTGRRALRAVPPRIALALGAVVAVNALATLLAGPQDAHWGKFVEEWWIKLLLLTVPAVAAGLDGRALSRVLSVALGAGLVAAGYGILQHYRGWDYVRDRELFRVGARYLSVGFVGHHLSFGGQLMIYLAVTLAVAARHLAVRPRLLLRSLPVALVFGVALMWTFSRSCFLGVFGAACLVALTVPGRKRAAGLAVLAAAVVLASGVPTIRERLAETFADQKEITRLNLWRSSVAGIQARPLLGWGPGNFEPLMAAHEYPGYYEVKAHAHNDYLMQAVNAGLAGLLVYLWLQWEIFRHLLRSWLRSARDGWLLPAALACQVAVALAGFFQVYQTDDEPEMLLYFVLGCGIAAASALPATAGGEAVDRKAAFP